MAEPETPTAKGSPGLRLIAGWNRWTGASVNRSIFGAALIVAAFTVVARLVSVAKELVVAGSFGTGDALDAYLIAFLLPSFTISVVAGSFNAALIPTFIKVRDQQGHEPAQRLLSTVMFWTLALLGAAVLVLFASARWLLPLIASGFSAEKLALTRALFYLLLPVLVLSGFSTLWSAILNAGQTFALPALVPVITPCVIIAAILAAGKAWGIYAVAGATLGGAVVETGFLGWQLKQRGYRLWPRRHPGDAAAREVLGQYLPMVAGALLMSSTLLVDQSMAAMLGPGSVAALNYGNKVVSVIVSIGSLAISTAILPHFSRMVAADDWGNIRHTLKTYSRLILLSALPITCILVFWSEPMTRLLFERGTFTARDTGVVSPVATGLAMQIPFFLVGIVGVRLLNAMGKSRSIMLICLVNMLVNVVANYVLMKYIGISGIALSTSLVYLISCALIFGALVHGLRKTSNKPQQNA